MKVFAYSIFDDAVKKFNQPFFARTASEMYRIMDDVLRDPNSQLARHPKDFFIYKVGEFDLETGLFDAPDHPSCIAPISDMVPDYTADPSQIDIED